MERQIRSSIGVSARQAQKAGPLCRTYSSGFEFRYYKGFIKEPWGGFTDAAEAMLAKRILPRGSRNSASRLRCEWYGSRAARRPSLRSRLRPIG